MTEDEDYLGGKTDQTRFIKRFILQSTQGLTKESKCWHTLDAAIKLKAEFSGIKSFSE